MKDILMTLSTHETCFQSAKERKNIATPSVEHQQNIARLHKQHQELKQQMDALSELALHQIDCVEKNEKMIRKQLFHFHKQNAHLEGRIRLLEQHMQQQNHWNEQVWRWILETKQRQHSNH